MKNGIIRSTSIAIVGVALFAGPALAYPGQKPSSHAKVTMSQARGIALREYPGKIVTGELERERGGSGLRFSFDIRGAHGLREVGVDAKSGKILENSKEGPNAD